MFRDSFPVIRTVAAGMMLAGLLAGCNGSSGDEQTPTPNAQHSLVPCFDHVLKNQPANEILVKPTETDERINIQFHADTQTVGNDPGNLRGLARSKVLGAVVKVVSDQGQGGVQQLSGFLAKDKGGDTVAVTVAHGVVPGAIENMTVTDTDGRTSQVTGGCYVYQTPLEIVEPGDKSVPSISTDIAILQLGNKIGDSTIEFADDEPGRGTWLSLTNFQQDADPIKPVMYTGFVSQERSKRNHMNVLTGVNPSAGGKNIDVTIIKPGSSGGLATIMDGEAVGMVRGANQFAEDPDPLGRPFLKSRFNLVFHDIDQANPGSFYPVDAQLIAAREIKKALKSDVLS